MRCNKAELQVSNTPPPTLWKPSIHAGSAHITCRKTVRMCSTWRLIHFRFLAHSLANARSLGLRRADDTITVLAALQLVNQRQYARHISLSCHLCFRNWSNQARNCTSSGFLTFASNAAPTTTFCAVSRLRLFASGAVISPQHQQSSVRAFCS